jgi:hypothetical protein
VVLEVASALVLLIGAALMLQTMAKLRSIDLGFRPEGILTLRTVLPGQKYDTPEKRQSFYDRVLESAAALPGGRERGLLRDASLPECRQYQQLQHRRQAAAAQRSRRRAGSRGYGRLSEDAGNSSAGRQAARPARSRSECAQRCRTQSDLRETRIGRKRVALGGRQDLPFSVRAEPESTRLHGGWVVV